MAYVLAAVARRGFKMILFTEPVSRRNIFVGGTCALPSALLVFSARRVCIAWTMPLQDVRLSVRPSVRLSHAGIECKRLYISSKFFSPSGNDTILVFPYQTGWQYSDGDPLPRAPNARGYEKVTIFDQYLALSR